MSRIQGVNMSESWVAPPVCECVECEDLVIALDKFSAAISDEELQTAILEMQAASICDRYRSLI